MVCSMAFVRAVLVGSASVQGQIHTKKYPFHLHIHSMWPVPVCCLRNLPISPTIRKQEQFLPSHPLYILLRW